MAPRWTIEELELLARALARIGLPTRRMSAAKVYRTFCEWSRSNQRTECAVKTMAQLMLKARTFVLKRGTWQEWLALPEDERIRACSSSFTGKILDRMNEAIFRALDEEPVVVEDSANISENAIHARNVDGSQTRTQTTHEHVEAGAEATDASLIERIIFMTTNALEELIKSQREVCNVQRNEQNGIIHHHVATNPGSQNEGAARVEPVFNQRVTALTELGMAMYSQMMDNMTGMRE